jgi:transcriptional regulator with XRE-family HTH domain
MANPGWADYLKSHLARLEWTNAYLADSAGLDRSLVGRWINEEAYPSVDSVRKVCRAIRRDIREGLEASGLLTRAELRRTGDTGKLELNMFDDDELLEEVRHRLTRVPGTRIIEHETATVAEASGADSAAWTEQDAPDSHDVDCPTDRQPHFSAG